MRKHPLARRLINWLMEPLAAILLTVCATTAVAQPFYIPSGSMEPTLQIGDALLGTKFAYGFSRWSLPYGLGPASETRLFGKLPARGDIVIFRKPGNTATILIKRVIGLPGDRIQMVHGRLVINGKPVPPGLDISLKIDGTLRGSGFTGCNSWSATLYPVKDQHLAVGPYALTKKQCPKDIMQLELGFLSALVGNPEWDLVNGDLVIKGPRGALRLGRSL